MVEGQRRFPSISDEARKRLDSTGERDDTEFKLNADAVKPQHLAASANWVALDASRDHVTWLVGVREHEHSETGVTTGEIVGLEPPHHQHVEKIMHQASQTFPVPVDVDVFEEGTATGKPFLRLRVRPTMPPHYDENGRLTYEGRVLLILPDGVQDVAVSVSQGVVNTRPWRPATTLPDAPTPTPTLPERTTTP